MAWRVRDLPELARLIFARTLFWVGISLFIWYRKRKDRLVHNK